MKPPFHPTLLALAVLAALNPQPARGGEFRDRVSPQELQRRQAQAGSVLGSTSSGPRDERAKSPTGQSILRQSVLLGDGRNWTLVPQGSVLHLPEKLSTRILKEAEGRIMPWTQFLARNRGWLSTAEVDLETAAGTKPFPDQQVEAWAKSGAIVIAVHQGGAISVRKQPEPKSP